jgi:hypothetical protein
MTALQPVSEFTSFAGWTMANAPATDGTFEGGICVGDGSGKFIAFGMSDAGIGYQEWTNINTRASITTLYPGFPTTGMPIWWRIRHTGSSTLALDVSLDGEDFFTPFTLSYSGFMGAISQIGFWANNSGATAGEVGFLNCYSAANT